MKNRIIKILTLAFVALFVFSGVRLVHTLVEYRQAAKHYESLDQYVTAPTVQPDTPADGDKEPAPPAVDPEPVPEPSLPPPDAEIQPPAASAEPEQLTPEYPQVDFDSLRAINDDVVAWLIIDGTEMSYPVVQGEDNSYYLKHQFDKKWSSTGCLFLDCADDPKMTGQNQIIYGHNMKAPTMFHDLINYKKQEYYDAHPTGWLITPTDCYRLQFFSGYVTDNYGDAWDRKFAEGEFSGWLKDCMARSVFTPNVTPTDQSRVLTLSTCSYDFDEAKFIVHAIMVP